MYALRTHTHWVEVEGNPENVMGHYSDPCSKVIGVIFVSTNIPKMLFVIILGLRSHLLDRFDFNFLLAIQLGCNVMMPALIGSCCY